MKTQYKYLTLFLLIAFLLPLICIVAQTIISNNFIRFIFYGIQAASPTISAIITLYFQKDKTSLIKMFSKKHLKMAFSSNCYCMYDYVFSKINFLYVI